MTRLEYSMTPDTQPAPPEIALRASFEQGCRDLNDRLNPSLDILTKRLKNVYQKWNEHAAHFASLANLLLEDIGFASGLLKSIPDTHLMDNTRFIDVVDRLDTPQAKYLAKQLLRHMTSAGQDMPFHDPLPVLRSLLDKEQALFSDMDRKALLARIEQLEVPETDSNSIKLNLDIIANSLKPLHDLGEQLETLLVIFRQLNEETVRLSRIEIEIKRLKDQTTDDHYNGQALRIDRPQLAMEATLRELEGKLASEKATLARNVAQIKEHFALDKRLIPAITAILNEIQFLSGDMERIKIEEIPEWETGLAQQCLTRARRNIPTRGIPSGIEPDILDAAFTFLKEHEGFLDAYNRAKDARDVITGIEIEILAAQENIIRKEKDSRATTFERSAQLKHHIARLEMTAEERMVEMDELTAILFEELEKLRAAAGIADPLENMEPDKFWANIEEGFGCGALVDAGKQLDDIEQMVQKLDLNIL